MGRASDAGRGRHGLLHPAKPAAEDFLSAQRPRRRRAAAGRKPRRRSTGVLVLMQDLTRTQREQRTQREKPALVVKVWVFSFVSFVTLVSFAPAPGFGVGAARNGVIRGPVEVL